MKQTNQNHKTKSYIAMETTLSDSMNGGDGEFSYNRNSSLQRDGVELIKSLIKEGIVKNFKNSSENVIRIADLGCSIGPNTFIAIQNIVDSIKLKLKHQELSVEFQVFFNDRVSNDFNTLFKNIPSGIEYFVAGVPGPFQGRLFPKKSIHFIHSSFALHWLSSSPKDLENKERIYHPNAPKEVLDAYSAQFADDTMSFLEARAQEVVHEGLMGLLILSTPDGVAHSECFLSVLLDLLGASLFDMANEGLIDQEKLNSFNVPIYCPSKEELQKLIEKDGSFKIQQMEPTFPMRFSEIKHSTLHFRAAWEGIISSHFGVEIIDELFQKFAAKVMASPIFSDPKCCKLMAHLFILLKRI